MQMDDFAKFDEPCEKFKLCNLKEGEKDRLGHLVEEIFWKEGQYAVYRSERGVYVQFADCPVKAANQQSEFTEISPELCELRYLTHEMRSRWLFGRRSQADCHPSSLYEHNMAQAIMLILEKKKEQGKDLAKQALKMAVDRVTSDNTAKYFCWCLTYWVALISIGIVLLKHEQSVISIPDPPGVTISTMEHSEGVEAFIVAAMFGVTGAMLSVATRLRAFELHPWRRSLMNYLMALTRIFIGFVSGPILLLLGLTVLKQPMSGLLHDPNVWQETAVLGLLGGFTERLVPNLLTQTSGQIESPAGTPVLATRSEQSSRSSSAANPERVSSTANPDK
jgi:hypothetical protein